MSPEQARREVRDAVVMDVSDLTLATPGQPVAVRLYRPARPAPAAVLMYLPRWGLGYRRPRYPRQLLPGDGGVGRLRRGGGGLPEATGTTLPRRGKKLLCRHGLDRPPRCQPGLGHSAHRRGGRWLGRRACRGDRPNGQGPGRGAHRFSITALPASRLPGAQSFPT